MDRRNLLAVLCGVCPLSALHLLSGGQGKGKGKGHGNKHDADDRKGGPEVRYFRQEDYAVVQRYYAGPRDLPPGLRKKYYRTGELPPGWQKKMRPFPPELVRVLPPPPPNCERGYIDGVAVVYNRTTRIIVDTIDLVAAISGH
ncbi:hypothetical protein [uncultured Paludibaculum sp.]|uniref:hypothetical protein n=1 Tax=uncultured Paludibaculum sp. TaxID=1765020 RepID=UPI002AAB1B40|nr:hypothetical protein [uncultured Paludibaculum sp.]